MIYFVTENYLKGQTPITKNVDVQNIAPWVRPVCETRLLPILGRYFYEYLLDKYNAQTLNADETKLVEVIQPCVAWRAAAQAVYGISRPVKNTGMQQLSSENSSGVNLEEVTFGMAQYDQFAAHYQNLLAEYVLKNRAKFPQFMSAENEDAKLRKACDAGVVDSGIVDIIVF